MISAINPSQKTSFTGVVPVRVLIDGLETFDEKLIKASCRQLSTVLAGPTQKEPKLSLIRKFAGYDRDYKLEYGFYGYPKQEHHKSIRPSEFFRCIIEHGKTFLITGPQGEKLHELGRAIGTERRNCLDRGIRESFDLRVAKINYGRAITNFINNSKIRIAEVIDGKRKPLTLIVNMKSNQKYGLSTFKMNLDNIDFVK